MKYLLPDKQNIFLRASVSDVCNFSCRYCATDLGMENHTPECYKNTLLGAYEYLRNMKMIAQHGFKNISFTGGEPLLNPHFSIIAKGCRSLFETTEITTNATNLINNIDTVRKYIDVLKISIDALDPALAAATARNPAAARTPQIIEQCCREGVSTIGLNFVYMKCNQGELPKLIDFAASLKRRYNTDIYISILDLYYSQGNRQFWEEQFVDLSQLREKLERDGKEIHRRLRIGCDSYNFTDNGVVVNMKDSISCTHRAEICDRCTEYCQEGIYSLKHSASGWISVCPTNNPEYGSLLGGGVSEVKAHDMIDKYVEILNFIRRSDQTGDAFKKMRNLVTVYE
ncbi:MAG: radical SAM protein [Oscillospiraceae bacterium]|nr:radical SAM protein [Oscillospiraceae bacterium]